MAHPSKQRHGGDQLVAALIGKEADAEHGDGIRDAEKTKPHPDLIKATMEKAGGDDAVMIGDSVWDCQAAKRAKVPTIALLTAFSPEELAEAGAAAVFESIADLRTDLDSTSLG